jgi:hypothetical protein
VVLWTTSIDGDWTDLPYRPGFLALTLSLLDATLPSTRDGVGARALEPGETVTVAIPSDSASALIRDPSGTAHALRTLGDKGSVLVVSGNVTQHAGAYVVEVTDDNGATRALPRAGFVVAPPLDESDLAISPPPATGDSDEARNTTVAQVKHALDNQVFAWALPLFVIEALLRMRRRRTAAVQPGL